MWELDCEESWAPKNWCFSTVLLAKTPESPLDCKEIQPVHSEGDKPWDFFGRNDDAKAETPVLWPPHAKSWLTGKDCDAGRDWGAVGKGDYRGWDGWIASPTRWTWVWVNSRSWWWTGRPVVLWFMGLQRVGLDWATELNLSRRLSYLSFPFTGTLQSAGYIFPFLFYLLLLFFSQLLQGLLRQPLCLLEFLFLRDGSCHHLLYYVTNLHP